MTTSYKKGYRFEKIVQKFFEEQGFFVARQGKSKFPDLIALKFPFILFIECKYNKKPSKQEINKLLELKEKYGIIPVIAMKKKGKRGFQLINPGGKNSKS